jgi:hypothetical protein
MLHRSEFATEPLNGPAEPRLRRSTSPERVARAKVVDTVVVGKRQGSQQ